jgi:hypothetical protein
MKNLKIKNAAKIVNWLINTQLILAPIQVRAEENKTGALETISNVMGAAAGITNQMSQSQQAQMQAQRQQMQMKAIMPQTFADEIFPMCKILPAKNNHITNICSEPITGPQDQMIVRQYKSIAEQNQNAYENFKFTGLSSKNSDGKACFKTQKELIKSGLHKKVNLLDDLLKKMEAKNRLIQKEVKKRKDALVDLTAELDGDNGATRDKNARDMSVFLNDPNCSKVLSQDQINAGKVGLRALRTLSESNLKEAQKIITNKETIEKDVRNQVKTLAKFLKQEGAQGLYKLDKKFGSIPNLPSSDYLDTKASLTEAMTNKVSDYTKQLTEIESEMFKMSGINPKDKMNTGSTTNSLKKDLKASFDIMKRDALKDCTFDAGTGINQETIINNLEQIKTNSAGTTASSFKAKVKAILGGQKGKKPIDTIISEIEKLEQQYGMKEVTLKINSSYDGKNSKYDWSPSELLKSVQQGCETRFAQDKLDEYGGLTQNEVFNKSYVTLAKYEKLENEMTNQITTAVLDRTLNCTGIVAQANPDSCGSGNMLSADKPNFCVKNATNCALNVQGCYALADKVIKEKEFQKTEVAKNYNNIVKSLATELDFELRKSASSFVGHSEFLRSYFPGTNYDLPGGENAFLIDLPLEEMDTKLGVALINDPEAAMNQLRDKIGAIQESIKKQNAEIESKIDTRIADLENAYAEEATYWQGLASTCAGLDTAYKENQAKAKADQDKQTAEDQKNLNDLCYKAQALSITPGCDSEAEDLSDAAQKVSNRITASELKKLSTLRGYCRNSSEDEEGDKEVTRTTIKNFCDTDGSADCRKFIDKIQYYLTDSAGKASCGTESKDADGTKSYSVTTQQAIDCVKFDDYNPAYLAYAKKHSSGSKDTNVSSIGQVSFSACNAVNSDGNKTNSVDNFIKQFGDAANSVKN